MDIKTMQQNRLARSRNVIENYRILHRPGYAVVMHDDVSYTVDKQQRTCSCPDYRYRCAELNIPCKHILAVLADDPFLRCTTCGSRLPKADAECEEPDCLALREAYLDELMEQW